MRLQAPTHPHISLQHFVVLARISILRASAKTVVFQIYLDELGSASKGPTVRVHVSSTVTLLHGIY